jgi:hypothetical protein
MKAKACKDCQYVKVFESVLCRAYENRIFYECRLNPPISNLISESKWPKVGPNDYCWQFKEVDVEGGRRWDDES